MKYKDMVRLGGTVSTESGGTIIPPLPMDGEYTDATLGDVQDAEVSLESQVLAISYLNGVANKVRALRASMLSNTTEPLTKVSVEAYSQAIDALVKPLGLKDIMVSMEGFAHDYDASLEYSAEGIKEVLMSLLERILKLIRGATEKAEGYVAKFFDATENLKGRYDSLAQKAEGTGGRSITTPTIDVSFTEASWVMDNHRNVSIDGAMVVFDKTVNQTLLGYPETVAKYVRDIAAVVAGWANDPSTAKNPDVFNGIKTPLIHGVNPNTGVKEDFNYTPYRIVVNTTGLGGVEFDDSVITHGEPPESVQVTVLQAQAILNNVRAAKRIIDNAITSKQAIEGLTNCMRVYGDAVEAISKLTIEDEETASALRERLVEANAAIRSWCDFPIRVAAKVMHGVSAAESIMSKMVSEGYGKKDTDAGATGKAAGGV